MKIVSILSMESPKSTYRYPIYLKVPFVDKDRVKELGAYWEPRLKQWYVRPHESIWPFIQWLPPSLIEPIKAYREYEIAERRRYEEWAALPPRATDLIGLLALLPEAPVKLSGFCPFCDSNFTNEWCFPPKNDDPKHWGYELHHCTQLNGRLRPSEYELLTALLDKSR